MERDALLAHGTSFLLQDRLMNCSDYSTAWVCRTCGSIISLGYENSGFGIGRQHTATRQSQRSFGSFGGAGPGGIGPGGEYCRLCRAKSEKEFNELIDAGKEGNAESVVRRGRGSGDMDVIALPFVFRYLVGELAAMGIDLKLGVE